MAAVKLPPASEPPLRTRRLIERLQSFIHTSTSGGLVLAIAAVVALLWANLSYGTYHDFWNTTISWSIGDWDGAISLQKLTKDGLMALFFLVVGLEIKFELTIGELSNLRLALVPLCAALGGMVVPAGIYAAFNAGGAGAAGWGIPMATDIAFAIGALTLLRRHVPIALPAFLLGIAVIDDIGAILVIAVFYSSGVSFAWLAMALVAFAAIWVLFRWKVRLVVPYLAFGFLAWAGLAGSGVSPTLAGVVIGFLVPVRPLIDPKKAAARVESVAANIVNAEENPSPGLADWRRVGDLGRQAVPHAERLQALLHPWSAFVVLPLFALAYAGVQIDGNVMVEAVQSPIAIGIAVGLVAGKLIGVVLGTWIPVKLGLGALPPGVGWAHITGVASLAGIGFTVSVFVASLAFTDPFLVDEARIGIVAGSLIAAVIGVVMLRLVARRPPPEHRLGEGFLDRV